MKVKELIEQLQYFDSDKEVILQIKGYLSTLGSIREFTSLDEPFYLDQVYSADQVVILNDE